MILQRLKIYYFISVLTSLFCSFAFSLPANPRCTLEKLLKFAAISSCKFTTHNETKASIVERFNRTLKGKMWKCFTANNTLKYIDILQKLVKSYNSSRQTCDCK